jgi:hypothetical protein
MHLLEILPIRSVTIENILSKERNEGRSSKGRLSMEKEQRHHGWVVIPKVVETNSVTQPSKTWKIFCVHQSTNLR